MLGLCTAVWQLVAVRAIFGLVQNTDLVIKVIIGELVTDAMRAKGLSDFVNVNTH